jgi:Polyketide cyclase / dehydrase and lipid transport
LLSEAPSSNAARKHEPVYLVRNTEITFDAPPEQAWPHVVDYSSWQDYPSVRHISGEQGQEGELVLMEKAGVAAPYYTKTIKLDPGRRIVWKCYPETPTEDNDYFGFVDFRVSGVEGGSCFRSEAIFEFMVPYDDESELDAFREQLSIGEEKLLVSLQRLKALVEGVS